MKNLIPMTDFVLSQNGYLTDCFKRSHKYAKFLKQPNELWMFVPCDEDGNVLEEPDNHEFYMSNFKGEFNDYYSQSYEYQQAKERCLFEGNFTTKILNENTVIYVNDISFYTSWNKHKTIEYLIDVESTLNKSGLFTLTQTAINLIGL